MPSGDVTGVLRRWTEGDPAAIEELTPLVYSELRRLAQRHLRREREGHSLQSAELVHEAYLRLVDQKRVRWQDRAHFFSIIGQIMRRILVDHARTRLREKRGGGTPLLVLNESIDVADRRTFELVALDDALESLARLDQQQSRVVELRFFAGLSVEETAEALRISPSTVHRDWTTARAWLIRELNRT
jgi:RNA polymerase sigma factor (TIGR02999 family)